MNTLPPETLARSYDNKSIISEENIKDWLLKQKDVFHQTKDIIDFIDKIYKSLDFNKTTKENFGNGEYLISVPILDNPSRHSNPIISESFLVLFENSDGEIRRGDIAILNDEENSIDSLSMYDLYSDNPLSTKRYSVKLVNLQGL